MPHSSFSSQSEAMYSILSFSIISSLLLLSSAEPCPDRKFETLKTVSVALLQDVVFRKNTNEENFLNFFVSPICHIMCRRIFLLSFIPKVYIPPISSLCDHLQQSVLNLLCPIWRRISVVQVYNMYYILYNMYVLSISVL